MNRIFKYSLVHDFAERYAGDINTFAGNADRRRKVKLEEASLRRLSKEFAGFEDLVKSMNDYQSLVDDESLFVWTVDKMQPIILSYMDAWRPHRKIGISYDKFWEIHHGQLQKGSPYCKEIFNTLLEYSKTKYYDQPATKIT